MIGHFHQNNSAIVETSIDQRQYNDAELVLIKTKLNLPYYYSSPEFERAYGSININGVDYEYVKRRVYQDTLELLCLPNSQKTKLNTVSNEIAKGTTNDAASPVKKNITLKISLPDYFQQTEKTILLFKEIRQTHFLKQTALKPVDYISQREKPPRLIIYVNTVPLCLSDTFDTIRERLW